MSKKSKELVDALEAAGITEDYRLRILIAIETEKLEAEIAILNDMKASFETIEPSINNLNPEK